MLLVEITGTWRLWVRVRGSLLGRVAWTFWLTVVGTPAMSYRWLADEVAYSHADPWQLIQDIWNSMSDLCQGS